MRKKHWWILPVLAILVILTLIALDERLTLRTYTVASPKLTAEVRLAVVTDFHSSDNADDVAAMTASCAPDAVLMVGDMFDDDTQNRPTERTLSLMRQLSALYPCYYVSGNHEAWTGEMDALYQQTEEAGVTVLRMSSGVLTISKTNMAQLAFSSVFGETLGNAFVAICLLFFAFSTIVGWNLFGRINVNYLFGKKANLPYSIIALVFIFLGSCLSNDLVWELTDMFNQLMVIPNVIALFALTKMVQGCTKGLKK